MGDTNYIGSIVKILENPTQKIFKNRKVLTTFRVQLPSFRKTNIVRLCFWGKLGDNVAAYYKINDYILIEGYVSIHNKMKKSRSFSSQPLKKVKITVLKMYPFIISPHSKRR